MKIILTRVAQIIVLIALICTVPIWILLLIVFTSAQAR